MKILFVCRANIGRSQMAKAFYNQYSQNGQADSAGTHVGEGEGKRIIDHPNASYVWEVMDEEFIDVRLYERKQLTPQMLEEYDIIVGITNKIDWPTYLLENNKVIHWEVDDPRNTGHEFHSKVRDQIKGLVKKLLEEKDS